MDNSENIYIEDLCSSEEFEQMSPKELTEYIGKTFYRGAGAPFKILAKITKIVPKVMLIEPEYFLTADNRALEFKLCRDVARIKQIGSSGIYDKMPRDSIVKYCEENNLHSNDRVICEIFAEENPYETKNNKHFLTFFVKTLKKVNITDLEEIYNKYNITFAPNQLYELRNDDKRELKIFVQDNLNSEIEKILAEGDNAIQEQKKIISDLETRSEELEKQIKIQQLVYDTLQSRYNEKYKAEEEKLQETLKRKFGYLQFFGISLDVFMPEDKADKIVDSVNFDNFEEMLDYWQKYLQKVHSLIYRKEILKSLYFGLQTDKLILLTGNPGTGKTSLVKALAKSFAFKDSAIISVQSNWTDRGDLLGYYNPIEKNYVATEFLDALIKFSRSAELSPDKLFIICLDEMNLAHVEHYFAEFLSSLQNNREIILYSEKMKQNIQRELQINGQNENGELDEEKIFSLNLEERKYYFELYRMSRMITDYPAKIKIPVNVKFFGTLNQDETTHDISPKVIDRAYIIRLEKNNMQLEKFDEDYSTIKYKNLENFSATHEEILDIDSFSEKLSDVANISKRVTKEILRNKNFETWTKILGTNNMEDFIIASFLLPKIRFDEDEYTEKIDKLKNLCEGHKLSEEILKQIDYGKEADFWRR